MNESTWSRDASHTAPNRLPPTGGCSDQLVVGPDRAGGVAAADARRDRRRVRRDAAGSGMTGSASARTVSGSIVGEWSWVTPPHLVRQRVSRRRVRLTRDELQVVVDGDRELS